MLKINNIFMLCPLINPTYTTAAHNAHNEVSSHYDEEHSSTTWNLNYVTVLLSTIILSLLYVVNAIISIIIYVEASTDIYIPIGNNMDDLFVKKASSSTGGLIFTLIYNILFLPFFSYMATKPTTKDYVNKIYNIMKILIIGSLSAVTIMMLVCLFIDPGDIFYNMLSITTGSGVVCATVPLYSYDSDCFGCVISGSSATVGSWNMIPFNLEQLAYGFNLCNQLYDTTYDITQLSTNYFNNMFAWIAISYGAIIYNTLLLWETMEEEQRRENGITIMSLLRHEKFKK